MVRVDLDEADKAALIALLKQAIAADPFPMSARSRTFKAIVAKLKQSTQQPTALRERQSSDNPGDY